MSHIKSVQAMNGATLASGVVYPRLERKGRRSIHTPVEFERKKVSQRDQKNQG